MDWWGRRIAVYEAREMRYPKILHSSAPSGKSEGGAPSRRGGRNSKDENRVYEPKDGAFGNLPAYDAILSYYK